MISIKRILSGFSISLLIYGIPIKSAETVTLINGSFSKSIKVSDIEYLSKKRKAKGSLKGIIKMSNQKEEEVAKQLNETYEMPIILTSKLLNSKIGEVFIGRASKIIHPIRVSKKEVSILAIRAGIIKGIYLGKGSLSIMNFIKGYPNKVMAVNMPALLKVINKVESISELVQFFSDSPLDRLKNSNQ